MPGNFGSARFIQKQDHDFHIRRGSKMWVDVILLGVPLLALAIWPRYSLAITFGLLFGGFVVFGAVSSGEEVTFRPLVTSVVFVSGALSLFVLARRFVGRWIVRLSKRSKSA